MGDQQVFTVKPAGMVTRALAQFRGCDSDPMQMGGNGDIYDALRIYSEMLVEVMRDMKSEQAR